MSIKGSGDFEPDFGILDTEAGLTNSWSLFLIFKIDFGGSKYQHVMIFAWIHILIHCSFDKDLLLLHYLNQRTRDSRIIRDELSQMTSECLSLETWKTNFDNFFDFGEISRKNLLQVFRSLDFDYLKSPLCTQ